MSAPATAAPPRGRGRPIKKVSTALVRAKDILENGRWTKGCLKNTRGAHCAMGAVYEAVGCTWSLSYGGKFFEDEVHDRLLVRKCTGALNRAAGESVTSYGGNIIAFNDSPKTTKKMVLKTFDRAIAQAKRDERVKA